VTVIYAGFIAPATAESARGVALGSGEKIAPGVYVRSLRFSNSSGVQRAHVMSVDLTVAGISVKPVAAYSGHLTTKRPLSSIVASHGAVGGINTDQFDLRTGAPFGGIMAAGAVLKSPIPARRGSTVYALADGRVRIGKADFAGSILLLDSPKAHQRCLLTAGTPNRPSCTNKLQSMNSVTDALAGRLTIFDSAQATGKLPRSGCTVVYGTYSSPDFTVTKIRRNARSFAVGGKSNDRALVGCGSSGMWLRRVAAVHNTLWLEYSVMAKGQPVTQMFSSAGLLRQKGKPVKDPARIAVSGRNPESIVCVSRDGRHLKLIAIDGRQGAAAPGITMGQAVGLTASLHCWSAAVLDGGGSTTLVSRRPSHSPHVINTPSDGAQRPIPSALLVMYSSTTHKKAIAALKKAAKKKTKKTATKKTATKKTKKTKKK
jgi:hypothetical protein